MTSSLSKFTNLRHPFSVFLLSTFLIAIIFSMVTSATGLSGHQRATISQNCATIKQSLKLLQRSDSKARITLGSAYQSILSDYIIPLNIRLVKENQPNSNLNEFQSSFASAKEKFSSEFIKYSQGLEELTAFDCQSDPEGFYERLISTRSLRAQLAKTTAVLEKLYKDHLSSVSNLKKASQ